MKKINYYTASESVATRARCLHSSYRTKDGRYIISENDVHAALPYMTTEEYATGFDIILVTKKEAERLVAENGYQIGPVVEQPQVEETVDETTVDNVGEEGNTPSEETGGTDDAETGGGSEEPAPETEGESETETTEENETNNEEE